MRLADEISASVGGAFDRQSLGAVSSLAASIRAAECFELTSDVASAIAIVRYSRPSSILAAITYARPPFPKTWVEWVCHDISKTFPSRADATAERPMPRRMGALIEEIEDGLFGITWAWSHRDHGIKVCPLGIVHAYRDGGVDRFFERLEDPNSQRQQMEIFNQPIARKTIDKIKQPLSFSEANKLLAQANSVWRNYAERSEEVAAVVELSKWSTIGLSPHAVKMMALFERTLPADQYQQLRESFVNDIEGEGAFIEAFLILLNTKNGVVSEKEDHSRLNTAREKAKKPPLREFQITRMSLSRHALRGEMSGSATREECRQHYVRGHFKVRRTGVYWWSPFVRGSSTVAVPRERYIVR